MTTDPSLSEIAAVTAPRLQRLIGGAQTYDFASPPPREPQLWFLQRKLEALLPLKRNERFSADVTVSIEMEWGGHWIGAVPDEADEMAGLCVRYEGEGDPLVWQLTDFTIPSKELLDGMVAWRLGSWPD